MYALFQEVIGSIRRNRLRTCLTGLAVAWGIFMLIVLLGAGNGLIHAFLQNSGEMSLGTISIYPGWTSEAYGGFDTGRRPNFDTQDLTTIQGQLPEQILASGAVLRQSGTVLSVAGQYTTVLMLGISQNYILLDKTPMSAGRFINEQDLRERRKSIVLNQKTAELLFGPKVDPVGRYVKAGDVSYRVVGIYGDEEDSRDTEAFIPITTAQTVYNRGNHLDQLVFTTAKLTTEAECDSLDSAVRRVLAANHSFSPTDRGAVWIHNSFGQYLSTNKAANILTVAIWIIALLTMLSGVVGVSNIMLITVKERTHEFGIRKAIGAKPRSILWLIITESVIITSFFGYIGMMIGILANEWMDATMGHEQIDTGLFKATMFFNPTVGLDVCFEATLVMIIAGTVAGLIPAYKAAHIRPIEALNSVN